MRRYQGEELAPGCRIAVIANDALGNYVVTTPLLQMIRSRHRPATLDFYAGNRTKELWSNDSNIDAGVSALGLDPGEIVVPAGPQYDLIVNVEESKQAKALCGAICGEETYVSGPGYCHTTQTDLPYTNDMQGRLAADVLPASRLH